MSSNHYAAAVRSVELRNADRTCNPRWVARFASRRRQSRFEPPEFSAQAVIRFLPACCRLNCGRPAIAEAPTWVLSRCRIGLRCPVDR